MAAEANQENSTDNTAEKQQEEESQNLQSYEFFLKVHKQKIIQEKDIRMKYAKYMILKQVKEDKDVDVCKKITKEVFKRCHNDIKYMVGGPKKPSI